MSQWLRNKDFISHVFLSDWSGYLLCFPSFHSVLNTEGAAEYLECFHSQYISFAETNHTVPLNQKELNIYPEKEKTEVFDKSLKDIISILLMNISEKVGTGFQPFIKMSTRLE